MKNKKLSIITAVIFLICIFGIAIFDILSPSRVKSETENRMLAQKPEFSLEALFQGSIVAPEGDKDKNFTTAYENYITDQFIRRDSWISLKTYTDKLIGKRDINNVYFADGGYLIEKLSPNEDAMARNTGKLADFYNAVSGQYNVKILIPPTASLILKDKLPLFATTWEQGAMLDKLSNELGDGFVDVRNALSQKKESYIYYKTDHHWTSYGAYIAYRELTNALGIQPIPENEINKITFSDDFLGTVIAKVNIKTEPDVLECWESKNQPQVHLVLNNGQSEKDSLYFKDKLSERDKYGVFLGGNPAIADITTSVNNGKTLLLIKDSYAHCMLPLLVNHYERIIAIDLRSFNTGTVSYLKKCENEGINVNDIVVLYNANGFADDPNIYKLTK